MKKNPQTKRGYASLRCIFFVVDCNKAIKESAILTSPVGYLNITVTENKRLQNFPSSLV